MDKWGGGEGAKAKGMLTWTPLKLLVGGPTPLYLLYAGVPIFVI